MLVYSILDAERQEVIDHKPWLGNCGKIAPIYRIMYYRGIFSDELPLQNATKEEKMWLV
jgi:hypothetical protein